MGLIILAVCMPPPFHGQAVVDAAIVARLATSPNEVVHVVDIGPGALKKGMLYHLTRLARVIKALAKIISCCRQPNRILYNVPDSGVGAIYSFMIVGLARGLRYTIMLHHHTYIHRLARGRRFAWLARLAGGSAVHVVLSDQMAADLRLRYPVVQHVIVSHNACHINPPELVEKNANDKSLRIGLLSNLSAEKGLDLALAIATEGQRRGMDLTLVLAGPLTNPEAVESITAARQELGRRLDFRGPLYGPSKARFFADIDVFIFPSRYRFEAQPLVVLEAMSYSLPIIAFSRGYTAELLGDAGVVVDAEADFVQIALNQLDQWLRDPKVPRKLGEAARSRFDALRQMAIEQLAWCDHLHAGLDENISRPIDQTGDIISARPGRR